MTDLALTIGRRIRLAREAQGLSLRGLAVLSDGELSHTALAKYETGVMIPGSGALLLLSRLLGESVDALVRPFTVNYTAEPKFRKRAEKLSLREERRIVNRSLDFFERYLEVEALLDDRIEFRNPLRNPCVASEEEVAERASELREFWRLGHDPLPNLQSLMTVKGIKVHEVETDNRAFDGFHAQVEGQPVIVLASWLNQNLPRKRMTEIHELAHALLRMPEGVDAKLEEKWTNRFAGEFLLPSEAFHKMWGKRRTVISMAELQQLKAFFGASIMAIMYRASQYDLVEKSLVKHFWNWVNTQTDWRVNGEPGDELYKGEESDNRFRQLVYRAVVEERMTESRAANMLKCDLARLRIELANVFR